MIETHPNVWEDEGIKGDARDYAKKVMGERLPTLITFDNLQECFEKRIYNAYMFGYQAGFHCGWMVGKQRFESELKSQNTGWKQLLANADQRIEQLKKILADNGIAE